MRASHRPSSLVPSAPVAHQYQQEVVYVPMPAGRTQTTLRFFCRSCMNDDPDRRMDFAHISQDANRQILQGENMGVVVGEALREMVYLRNGWAAS